MSGAAARASAFDLTGRVILITGGAGLLGAEHAAAIAEAGGVPVIADLRSGEADKLARETNERYGSSATALEVDVASRPSCEAALFRVLSTPGRPDGLGKHAAPNPK